MSTHIDPNQALQGSLIDRLIDDDPEALNDPPISRGAHLDRFRTALRRDIEALLNAHQFCRRVPRELTELPASLLDFGLPNFMGLTTAADEARDRFRGEVENVLRRFEPRFKRIAVSLVDTPGASERTLRLRIEGLVHANPAPEPILFDSRLDPTVQRFSVTSVMRD